MCTSSCTSEPFPQRASVPTTKNNPRGHRRGGHAQHSRTAYLSKKAEDTRSPLSSLTCLMAYLGDPRHRRQKHSEVWTTLYDVLYADVCSQRRLRGLFARTPPLNPALTLNYAEKRYRDTPENIRLLLSIRLPGDARTKCGKGGPSQPRRLQPTAVTRYMQAI